MSSFLSNTLIATIVPSGSLSSAVNIGDDVVVAVVIGADSWRGSLAHVAIFDTVLTAAQILEMSTV